MAPRNTKQPSKRATKSATVTPQLSVSTSSTTALAAASQGLPDKSSAASGDLEAAQARAIELGYGQNELSSHLNSDQYIFCSIEFPDLDDPVAPAFETSCLLDSHTKAVIESLKPFSEPPDSENIVSRPVAGRADDLGLFTSTLITAGSTIISERPTVLFPSIVSLSAFSGEMKSVCQTLVDRLVVNNNAQLDDQASEIRKLKNSFLSASCLEEGVMRTNGLAVSFPGTSDNCRTFSAVFLNISRCNHSCSPNAILMWNPKTFAMSLLAVRDIAVKEEVTVAYTDILKSQFKRNKALQTMYSFKCGCGSCSALSSERKARDLRRASLQSWLDEPNNSFAHWRQAAAAAAEAERKILVSAALRDLNALIECFSMEGLESLRAQHMKVVDSLARTYGALGNRAMFLTALERAIKVWMVDSDRSRIAHERVNIYETWRHEPESFSLWDKL